MSWRPNDLVSDADLLAYEADILTRFRATDWQSLRNKVLEDWIWPQLRTAGFDPARFRTRHTPAAVFGVTSGVSTDLLAAATSATVDDLALATILAAGTDALAIGSTQQFRGLSVRILDTVSAVTAVLTVELWQDGWRQVGVADGTGVAGVPFARGGSITWSIPSDWVIRPLSTATTPLYWARLRLSAVPTGATCGQVSVIQRSVLCAPATLKTLAQIYRIAPNAQDGPWADRVAYYESEAALCYQRAVALVGSEFDADVPSDDVLDRDDEAQTREDAGSPFRWERA